ncbi:hypothetical protein AVEN_163507-1 [Araneus ventricosus]|uniref:Uncharacterized protein n=1 Tax=Araneus ventricosus TaxID=182803 RepID=A0A4Y2BPM6_ARAVE|nr:hypothetical protein AVEN_163507-1 [Araneus ventricosus]
MLRYACFASKLSDKRDIFHTVNDVCFSTADMKLPYICGQVGHYYNRTEFGKNLCPLYLVFALSVNKVWIGRFCPFSWKSIIARATGCIKSSTLSSTPKLWIALIQEWDGQLQEQLANLVLSMTKRGSDCLATHNKHTAINIHKNRMVIEFQDETYSSFTSEICGNRH